MDTPRTPRTPRDNLRTGPGDLLEELEDTPLLPRYSASPPGDTPPGEVPPGDAAQGKGPSFEAAWSEGKRCVCHARWRGPACSGGASSGSWLAFKQSKGVASCVADHKTVRRNKLPGCAGRAGSAESGRP